MDTGTKVILTLAAVIFMLLGGMFAYSCSEHKQIAYSEVPTPYGIAKVAPGQSVDIDGNNNLADTRSGKSDQGSAHGDEVKLAPGAQAFSLNDMMASQEKGAYFAKHIVRTAWLIILIGAVILGIGVALTFTGIGAPVAIPIMIIGGIVMGAGFVAMIVESASGMWLLLASIAPIGYMIWKSKQKTKAVTTQGDTLDEITADIQALGAHVTAGNAAVVQAQFQALMKKLGL